MANAKKNASVLTKETEAKLAALETTSAKIRFLHAEGHDRGDISRILNIRYQWVRNVLITPLKKV